MSAKSRKDHRHYKSFPSINHANTSIDRVVLKSTVSNVAIPIAKTPDYLERLKSLMHSEEVLVAAGYTVEELSDEALETKKRCSGCGKRMLLPNPPYKPSDLYLNLAMSRFVPKKKKKKKEKEKEPHTQENLGHARNDSLSPVITTESPSKVESRIRCKFHSGLLIAKVRIKFYFHKMALIT
jgi:hypothetical protein